MKQFYHHPVMAEEVVEFLAVKSNGIYVDGTIGGAGHSKVMLRKSQISLARPDPAPRENHKSQITIVGIDQDEEAIVAAKKRLKKYAKNIVFVHDNFRNLEMILDKLGIDEVDGILFDLGVSSYQLDKPDRGFSFKEGVESVLDMRMDQRQKLSAQDVVNNYCEEELRKIFFEYGEEPFSRQIARAIVIRRREKLIKTTNELLDAIRGATPPKYRFSRRSHYASKIFRAIRMEVNVELDALQAVLTQAVGRLKKGGRLVVISFHSLEDKIVKHFFREKKNEGAVKILTKKPLAPAREEITLNPRAKSAKMRVAEKC